MKPNNPPEFTALIGLDWGDKSHAIALEPANGSTETSTLEHSAESLHQWLDQLEQRFGARQVAIAIETDQGAVVYALLERPWITIYPIHPATSTRHRTMFRPSGAADDLPDALVLLSPLQHHRQRLRPLQLDGGYVYRGPEFPRMAGIYFYGDFLSGRFWGLKFDGTNWQSREFTVPQHYIVTFGEDDSGNLYFADYLTGIIYTVSDGGTAASPAFSLRSGSYNTEQTVRITCDTPDAVIHYTTDGSDPSDTTPTIASGETIPVNFRMTLKARAYRPDLNPSPTTSAQYFLYVGLSFDPAVGPITNQTQVKIKASTSGVTIRYTLDGSDPSDPASTPALYSGPLLLDGNTTLKAVGFKDRFDYKRYRQPVLWLGKLSEYGHPDAGRERHRGISGRSRNQRAVQLSPGDLCRYFRKCFCRGHRQ